MTKLIHALAAFALLAGPVAFAQDKPKGHEAKHDCCCAKEKGSDCAAACARNACKGACAKKGHAKSPAPAPAPTH